MKKQDVFNDEINPDFISDQLDNLNSMYGIEVIIKRQMMEFGMKFMLMIK